MTVVAALLSVSIVTPPSHSQSASAILPTEPSYPIPPPKPSHWLILIYKTTTPTSLEKIEMQSKEQCKLQGSVWENGSSHRQFLCLEGK
jgi:hypothetical protein